MSDITTLADLTPDPENARKHTPRNVGAIVDALHEVGAARSIVIDERGVVLAGNATVDAAGEAGIERVRVIDADGEEIIAVRRTGLTDAQKKRLALFDNRAADLAEWDAEQLARDLAEGVDFDGLFSDDELARLLSQGDILPTPGDAPSENLSVTYGVIIDCATEKDQMVLIERFMDEGLNVRAVMS